MSTANTLFVYLVPKKFEEVRTGTIEPLETRRIGTLDKTRSSKFKASHEEAVNVGGLQNTKAPLIDIVTINGD